jgi:NADPH:quinone reductase-like Zn-dependent oxidoreductase
MTLEPDKLVKVPEGLDPAQVACLPEVYLSAFQSLHFGQTRTMRYRNNSLKGKSVLIIGFMANNMGSAIIELALKAGAANVYATAKKKHWKTLIGYGVTPLSQDPVDWILRVECTIDLLLATNGGLREDVTRIHYQALCPTGQLILCGHRTVGNDVPVAQWEKQHNASSLVCSKNKALTKLKSKSHAYDVYRQWENDLALCKADLEHLLKLLERGGISPSILDRIPLSKVPRAHALVESKCLAGFLVCEPWMKAKQRAVYM